MGKIEKLARTNKWRRPDDGQLGMLSLAYSRFHPSLTLRVSLFAIPSLANALTLRVSFFNSRGCFDGRLDVFTGLSVPFLCWTGLT